MDKSPYRILTPGRFFPTNPMVDCWPPSKARRRVSAIFYEQYISVKAILKLKTFSIAHNVPEMYIQSPVYVNTSRD